jgi:hypothetical protein
MVKFPSKSEVVPVFSPTTNMVAPGSGTPSSSVILPEIEPCASATCVHSSRVIKVRIFFIINNLSGANVIILN